MVTNFFKTNVQNDLGQFKLMVIEKQGELRSELKDIEKRKQEMEDHEASVQRMQKLMADSKLITSQTMPLPESDKEIYQVRHLMLIQGISQECISVLLQKGKIFICK